MEAGAANGSYFVLRESVCGLVAFCFLIYFDFSTAFLDRKVTPKKLALVALSDMIHVSLKTLHRRDVLQLWYVKAGVFLISFWKGEIREINRHPLWGLSCDI